MTAMESSATTRSLFSSPRKRSVVLSLLLALATLAVYNSVVHNAFINLDDNDYVTNNKHVQAGADCRDIQMGVDYLPTLRIGIR